ANGDPKKPKGKMSAYAFFVQTCREEHKKKNPEVPVNFAEFSKKSSERWKTMSSKEKPKFDEMAKVYYDREMKGYRSAKGGKKQKDSNALKRPPSGCFLFCSEVCPNIKSTNPSTSLGDVAKKPSEMWNNLSDSKKQPYITKKDVTDSKFKGKFDVARKKVEEEEEEEEEEEKKEEKEEDQGKKREKRGQRKRERERSRKCFHFLWGR
uniref:HMG box domain-containing protein n=1 Tax=Jaculus jaculus TaxID=51337 RepID=A0A8C5KT49_JACJA